MNIKYSTKCHKCNRFKNNECYFDSDTIKGCKANNYYHFVSREEDVRKDEREKIIDELWLSITDDKKIIFEKDGHKFKLNLVPIINLEEE